MRTCSQYSKTLAAPPLIPPRGEEKRNVWGILKLLLSVFVLTFLCLRISAAGSSPLGGIRGGAVGAFPTQTGEHSRYSVQIDIRNAYLSGICVVRHDGENVQGAIVNEFGLSAMTFTYSPAKNKIVRVKPMKKLDKWYIRKVLKSDLRQIIHMLQKEQSATLENRKLKITYSFIPLREDEITE